MLRATEAPLPRVKRRTTRSRSRRGGRRPRRVQFTDAPELDVGGRDVVQPHRQGATQDLAHSVVRAVDTRRVVLEVPVRQTNAVPDPHGVQVLELRRPQTVTVFFGHVDPPHSCRPAEQMWFGTVGTGDIPGSDHPLRIAQCDRSLCSRCFIRHSEPILHREAHSRTPMPPIEQA